MSGSVIAHAPAKLNLVLAVRPQVVKGKHLLQSIFCTLALADTIVFDFVSESRPFSFELTVEDLLPGEADAALSPHNNSLTKTLEHFEQIYGREILPSGKLSARLFKSIPAQAGLGGGSADAAAMLRMLCWLAQLDPLSPPSLKIAHRVGADVPFFLRAAKTGSCAWMGGFGNRLLQMLPKPSLDIVLVKPTAGVSTRAAYQSFDNAPQPPASCAPLRLILQNYAFSPAFLGYAKYSEKANAANENGNATPAFGEETDVLLPAKNSVPDYKTGKSSLAPADLNAAIAAACANNLEAAASTLVPQITELQIELESCPGVLKALLCGSGSAVFAICANAAAAQSTLRRFSRPDLWAVATRT